MAIESGRLNDAFGLLQHSIQAKHADGQRLIDRLIGEFLIRAESHLDHGRLEPAQRDVACARELGGQQVETASLQSKIDAKKISIVGRVKAGEIEVAKNHLKLLVEANDHEGAIKWLGKQSRFAVHRQQLETLAAASIEHVKRQAANDFILGRLDRCRANVELLERAGFDRQDTVQLRGQLDRCASAWQAIEQANFGLATQRLKLALQISPTASWVKAAIESVEKCQQGVQNLASSPLGLLDEVSSADACSKETPTMICDAQKSQIQISEASRASTQDGRSHRAVLQIDQLGRLLLLQGDLVSIGTPNIASRADIVLQTEGLKAKISIMRDGEDYLASSTSGFFVNQVFANRHLLSPGDIIVVGSRGRLKFTRPMLASNSAVLMVQGARMKRRDIRGIVLVDDSVVLGDSGCHFPVADLPRRIIIRPSDRGQTNKYLISEKGTTTGQQLVAGQTQLLAGVGFTLLDEPSPSQKAGS
jgi:hypothetical protein